MENIGFILDDGKVRLYITSDTITFPNDYKADVLFAPATSRGVTMGAFEVAELAAEIGAKRIIIGHLDNVAMYEPMLDQIEKTFKDMKVNYEIPKIKGEIKL